MNVNKIKRRSRRGSSGLSKRQLFLIAGAFLFLPLVSPNQASAEVEEEPEEKIQIIKPTTASPLLLSERENELRVQEVEADYYIKQALIQEKIDAIDEARHKSESISEKKLTLEEEIVAIKAEIETMKTRVAQKKALEAEQARLARERARALENTRVVAQSSYYNTAGNTYARGYCTWYVKNMRPDIPNGLGNANTWYYRAQSMGLSTGATPKAGAVGTTTRGALGHVVYVHSVNDDGTVNISEMNYRGWNQVTHRTVHASEFLYIYP